MSRRFRFSLYRLVVIGALLLIPRNTRADAVTDWHTITVAATPAAGVNSLMQTRVLAMAHVVVDDAEKSELRRAVND